MEELNGAGETAQPGRVLLRKPDDLSLMSDAHVKKSDVLVCICIPSTSYSKMEDRDKRISQFLGQLAPSTQLSI